MLSSIYNSLQYNIRVHRVLSNDYQISQSECQTILANDVNEAIGCVFFKNLVKAAISWHNFHAFPAKKAPQLTNYKHKHYHTHTHTLTQVDRAAK